MLYGFARAHKQLHFSLDDNRGNLLLCDFFTKHIFKSLRLLTWNLQESRKPSSILFVAMQAVRNLTKIIKFENVQTLECACIILLVLACF